MNKDGLNQYLRAGILLVGVTLGINHLIGLPHFLYGLGLGLGLALELFGAFAAKHKMKRIRDFKNRLLSFIVK